MFQAILGRVGFVALELFQHQPQLTVVQAVGGDEERLAAEVEAQ